MQLPKPNNVTNDETIGYVEYYGVNMDRSILTQLHKQLNNSKH